jgi:fibronectin type 3 domain-containing protein
MLLCGCGKVGDPRPPKMRTPAAITDLKVSQNENKVVLTWTNPQKYVDGSNATDLMGVHILQDGKPIETVPVSGPGKQQTYTLPNVTAGTTPSFTLEVETQRGKTSAPSKAVGTAVVEVPGVVLNLRGAMDQHRIHLEWDPPARNPALAEVYVVRREEGSFAEAVTETHWEDRTVEAGKIYSYIVTAARSSVPPVSGPPSMKITVIATDKQPPAAPAGLQPPVVSDSGAILRWDRSTEEDLAGYKVYRSENPAAGNGGWAWLGNALLTLTSFTDGSYRSGSYYTVSAVDDSGNESEKSAPVRAP